MGQSDPLHALKIASKSSKKTQKKKKQQKQKQNKTKTKVGIMIIENKYKKKKKDKFFFLKKKHLRELRKLRVKERIGEQKDQIGFQMKQQEEALALEPDSITLMTFLSLSLSLSLSDSLLFFLFQLLFFFLIFSLVFVKDLEISQYDKSNCAIG